MKHIALCASMLTVALAGCAGSNYASKPYHMPDKPDVGAGDIGGIPFTLNKPRFTVIRTPGQNGAPHVYQLKADYVPDPSQRYVVRLDPATFANTDWTVTLDEGGSLSDTNGKITDQSATLLTSVAKVAIAAAALSKTETSFSDQLKEIDDAFQANLKAPSPAIFEPTTGALRAATPLEAQLLAERWPMLIAALRPLALEGRISTFAYAEPADRLTLETAIRLTPPQIPDTVTKNLEVGNIEVAALAHQVKHAFEAYQLSRLTELKSDLVTQRRRLFEQQASNEGADADDALVQNKRMLDLVVNAANVLGSPPRELLLNVIDITHVEWQRRRLQSLNSLIVSKRFATRVLATSQSTPPVNDIEAQDAELQTLLRQKAALLGMLLEYEQLALLRAVPMTDPDKFNKAALGIGTLLKQLQEAETALNPPVPSAAPDEGIVAALLIDTDHSKPDSHWVQTKLDEKGVRGKPRYVVVIEAVAPKSPELGSQEPRRENYLPDEVPPPPKDPTALTPKRRAIHKLEFHGNSSHRSI